jgi:hypothetical protein
VLFLHNTSRVEDEPYPKLLSEKGFTGFPSICFMDADGNVLSKPPRTVAGMAETRDQTQKLLDLRAKGDKATAAEQKELFLSELKLGLLKAPDIQPRADKVALTDAEKAYVAGKVVDVEVSEIMTRSRQDGPEKTGAALAALLEAGKTPSDEVTPAFWPMVLSHASKQKDGKLAQRAYDTLVKRAGDKAPPRQLESWKKLLDEANAK